MVCLKAVKQVKEMQREFSMERGRVTEAGLMPKLVEGYTNQSGRKLKNCHCF
jgi:hypothetical protein